MKKFQVEKDDRDSDNSEYDIDEYYARSAIKEKQKQLFAYSEHLSTRERIDIFRLEFAEFQNLDEEHIRTLIYIYDKNLGAKYNMSDPAISTVGGLLLWVGWLFFNSASGYEIVDFTLDGIPTRIAVNTLAAGACSGLSYSIHNYTSFASPNRMRV